MSSPPRRHTYTRYSESCPDARCGIGCWTCDGKGWVSLDDEHTVSKFVQGYGISVLGTEWTREAVAQDLFAAGYRDMATAVALFVVLDAASQAVDRVAETAADEVIHLRAVA